MRARYPRARARSHVASTQGFTLEFTFASNPYFANEVLTKKYTVEDMLTPMEEPTLVDVSGCARPPPHRSIAAEQLHP